MSEPNLLIGRLIAAGDGRLYRTDTGQGKAVEVRPERPSVGHSERDEQNQQAAEF